MGENVRGTTPTATAVRLPAVRIGLLWRGERLARAFTVGLLALILTLIIFPWQSPSPPVVLNAFLPHLITVSPQGSLGGPGEILVEPRELRIVAGPHSQPGVHLLTSEVPFTVEISATVLERRGAATFPFQVKVWNPTTEAAAEIWYAPDGSVIGGARMLDEWQETRSLGRYEVGEPQTLRVVRGPALVVFEVGRAGGARFEVDRRTFPSLFSQDTLSVTTYATALKNSSSLTSVINPRFTVLDQRRYGLTVASPMFRPTVLVVALLSLLSLVPRVARRPLRIRFPAQDVAIAIVLTVVSVSIGWRLAEMPGHPLDERSIMVWSRLGGEFGPAALTGYSLFATEGDAHGGKPYAALPYPYPPLQTYLFSLFGNVPADSLLMTFKRIALLALGFGGAVLFALLRRLGVRRLLAAVVAASYAMNPAMLFASAVWGQTDPFVALFLIGGTAGLLVPSAPLLWIGVLLAALTKQTGALFGSIVVALGLARLGVRPMLRGVPPALAIAFLVLTPALLWGMHPSAIYRPFIATIRGFMTIRGTDLMTAVSQSTFTLWSFVTWTEGARGWERLALSDVVPTVFGTSYFVLSRVTFAAFLGVLAWLVLPRIRQSRGSAMLAMAAYAYGAVLLLTRVSPRYLLFSLLFLTMSLPWHRWWAVIPPLTVVTFTTLISMWGMMAFVAVWYPGLIPAFHPEHSALNQFAAASLGTDLGLTMGTILGLTALGVLLVALSRTRRAHPSPS